MTIYDVAASIQKSKARPRDDQLSMADEDGWTVAHILASKCALPADFNDFALADNTGWTVAHVVAQNLDHKTMNRFADEIYELKDHSGVSVGLTLSIVTRNKLKEVKKILTDR